MIVFFLTLNYKTSAFMTKLARVDWIGSVVFVASATGFLLPVTYGGVMYPWSHWRVLVPLILCGVALTLFVFYEEWLSRRGLEPIIRTSVFKNRTAAVTFFTTVIRTLLPILSSIHDS